MISEVMIEVIKVFVIIIYLKMYPQYIGIA